MLPRAERVDFVLGVDTHKQSHTAAVVTPAGELHAPSLPQPMPTGTRVCWPSPVHTRQGRRVWAIEGTGSFGAGLTSALLAQGEQVVEIDRPARPARRNGANTDELDAVRAAREALAREHLAQPRQRGEREALRVLLTTRAGAVDARRRAICHVKSLVVNAPESLRQRLRPLSTNDLLRRCARLRVAPSYSAELRATVSALRITARRAVSLQAETTALEAQLAPLVQQLAPTLLAEPGVGTITAAQILCAWSHAGRLRSEAAFAALAGVAPIPASSGQVHRHRLNRSGDRQLNRALHTIILARLRSHQETFAYAHRRTLEGKSPREIKRCLKRHLARRLFKLLEAPAAHPPVDSTRAA